MNTASQNRLNKVHPELKKRVTALIEALANEGLTVEVVQGLRTFQEQKSSSSREEQSPVRWSQTQREGSQITITVWQWISARL